MARLLEARKGGASSHLEIGEPDFATPDTFTDCCGAGHARTGQRNYTAASGIREVREKTARLT